MRPMRGNIAPWLTNGLPGRLVSKLLGKSADVPMFKPTVTRRPSNPYSTNGYTDAPLAPSHESMRPHGEPPAHLGNNKRLKPPYMRRQNG